MKARSNKKSIFTFLAVVGLLIFLSKFGFFPIVEKGLLDFFSPLGVRLHEASSLLAGLFREEEKCALEDGNDEEKIRLLLIENSSLKLLAEENKALREYFNFFSQYKYKHELANIISRSYGFSGRRLIIDKGIANGLDVGRAVIDERGAVIGKITAVKESLAEACLLVDKGCQLAAGIQNEERTIGVTEGELGLTIGLGLIPQNEKIAVGDLVVTSGLEENIPRGLLIGEIIKVDKESNEIWQSTSIKPLVDLDDLSIVSVVI